MSIRSALLGGLVSFGAVTAAFAADPISIVAKDNIFTPGEIRVPAGERFRLELQNGGTAPVEFESAELKIEKVVVPGGKAVVSAGPLKPGSYKIIDEYHPETTGTITAVQGLARR